MRIASFTLPSDWPFTDPCRTSRRFIRQQSGTDAGAGGTGDTGDKGGQPKTLTLSEEEFEERIKGRLRRARQQWERENGGAPNADEAAELQRLRTAEKEREQKELERKGEYDRILKSKDESFTSERTTWQKERDELLGTIRKDRIDNALISAAAKHGAKNPSMVAKLLRDEIDLDEKREVVVLDEDRKPRLKGGQYMPVEERVREFLDQTPELVAPSNPHGGAGSRGGASTSAEGSASRGNPQVRELEEELAKVQEAAKKGDTGANVKVLQIQRRINEVKKKSA